jgi:hypothetical protein
MRKEQFFAGIWGEGTPQSRKARLEAVKRIKANSDTFLRLAKALPSNYKLEATDGNVISYSPSELDDKKLQKLIERVPETGTYFIIGPQLTPKETINKKSGIVTFCTETVNTLLPLYSFVTGTNIPIKKGGEKAQITEVAEKVAVAHILAGKNLVFYGPPGTGKTRLAIEMANQFCEDKVVLRTANAEWTAYDVIGGMGFCGSKETNSEKNPFELEFRRGFLTEAVKKTTSDTPCWLIIDEINRANLDLSFGKAFTLLDIEHRNHPLIAKGEFPGVTEEIKIPRSFRIIATMNSYDKAVLFSLGFAFRRRFAFIEIPSPFKTGDKPYELDAENHQKWLSRISTYTVLVPNDKVFLIIEESVAKWIDSFTDDERLLFARFLNLESDLKRTFEKIKNGGMNPYDPYIAVYSFAKEISEKEQVEFGFAQLVDAFKFLTTYIALESSRTDVKNLVAEAVDQAFLAYFMPQFEYIIPDLRKERISGEQTNIQKMLGDVEEMLSGLGLKQSARKIKRLKDEQKVF